jgi:hypothetical protein
MISSVVAWGLILSPAFFALGWITGIREFNLLGAAAIAPLCIASVGALIYQILGLPRDIRKR